MNNQIDWKKYVDKIYLLNFTKTKSNIKLLYDELKRIGIFDSGIFYEYINISSPIYRKMYEQIFDKSDPLYYNICCTDYSTLFDSTYCHYFMIKQGYELGYNRIMIIEDDIRFLKDINIIYDTMENIYNDNNNDIYVIQNSLDTYHNTQYFKQCIQYKNYINNEASIYGQKNIDSMHGAACNIYTRKGMETIINKIESLLFGPIDLYNRFNCNICFVYPNFCTQQHMMYTFNETIEDMYVFDTNDLNDLLKILNQLQQINVSTLSINEICNNVLRLKDKYNWEQNILWNKCLSLINILNE